MYIWALLHFSAGLMFAGVLFYIVKSDPKSSLNRMCAILFFFMAVWSLDVTIRNLYVSQNTVIILNKALACGWAGLANAFLWVNLVFTGQHKKFKFNVIYPVSWLPSLLVLYKQVSTGAATYVIRDEGTWWGAVWTNSIWFYIFTLHYIICFVISIYVLTSFIKNTKNNIKIKQAQILLICTVIPFVFGIIFDTLLPKLGMMPFYNLSDIFSIVWVVGMVYSMNKYGFMLLTPAKAADNIIESMAESLLLVGADRAILTVNKFTCDLLGYKREELEGKPVALIFGSGDENSPFYDKQFDKMLETGSIRNHEVKSRTKGGDEIPMSFSGTVSRNKEGKMIAIVCVARDIRETKKLVKREKELAEEMVQAEAEKAKSEEIEKAYNKLQNMQKMLVQSEKLKALGHIAAGVAHELNNPLTGILSLMRSYLKKKSPEDEEYQDLEEMYEGCEYMAKVIKGLSEFTRESEGRVVELDCNEVVDSVIGFMQQQIERKGINIEKKYECENPFFTGDRRQIQQVIINLLNNATYSVGKDGEIKVFTKNILKNGKEQVVFGFSDNGIGMSEEIKEKIFDHFFTTKEPGEGIGLGLTIVHSIIKLHNGDVEVESEEGAGSTFRVILPAADHRHS